MAFLVLGDLTFVYYLRGCHSTAAELQAKIEEVRTERQLSIDRVNILEQENGEYQIKITELEETLSQEQENHNKTKAQKRAAAKAAAEQLEEAQAAAAAGDESGNEQMKQLLEANKKLMAQIEKLEQDVEAASFLDEKLKAATAKADLLTGELSNKDEYIEVLKRQIAQARIQFAKLKAVAVSEEESSEVS